MAVLFGLDIGRTFIKVVQAQVRGNKKVLKAAGIGATPEGGIQTESPVGLKQVSDRIKSVLAQAKIGTNHCAISLIESQVVSRLIQMPPLTDKELAAAIDWEAEQYIPLPIKDVVLKYHIVAKRAGSSSEGGKMDVLLVAVPKRIVEKYLNIVRDAGLIAEAIETESAALARSLTHVDDPPTVIVSAGGISTELVIVQAGNVLFTRSIATGGINLTRAIIAEFNLPQKQAEEYKQTYGILEDQLSGKVAAVLKPILDVIVLEIAKAVEFARTRVEGSPVERVIITGGGAFLPGLAQYLVERTGLEVALGDPWLDFAKEGLVMKLAGQGGIYSVATGLALRN